MRKLVSLVGLLCFLAMPVAASESVYRGPELRPDYEGPIVIDNSRFVYPASEKLTFSTASYLEENAAYLLPLRPAIDVWAARHGVHPRVLIAVVDAFFGGRPTTGSRGEMDQVVELASGLASVFWERFVSYDDNDPLAASKAVDAVRKAYGLPLVLPPDLASPRARASSRGAAPPLFGYFQPPWQIGDTWAGGGAHGDTGSGLQNALDFWGEFRVWGQDVSQWLVSAMQAGTARVWASCGMTIIHDSGWEATLYHLDNIQVADFELVERNQWVANYANNEAQALCAGGSSSGPHVHMAIEWDGMRVLVDETNLDFTAFAHHVGVGQYDSDCSRSYYPHFTSGTVCPNFDLLLNNAPLSDALIFGDGFESGGIGNWSSSG